MDFDAKVIFVSSSTLKEKNNIAIYCYSKYKVTRKLFT